MSGQEREGTETAVELKGSAPDDAALIVVKEPSPHQ